MARYINQLQNDNKALKRQVTLLKRKLESKKTSDATFRAAYLPKPTKKYDSVLETRNKELVEKIQQSELRAADLKEALHKLNLKLEDTAKLHKLIDHHKKEIDRLKRGNATLQSKLGAYQATVNGLCSLNVVNRRK